MACRVFVQPFEQGYLVHLSWRGGRYALVTHAHVLTQNNFRYFMEQLAEHNRGQLQLTDRTSLEVTPDYMLYIAEAAYPRYERVIPVCPALLQVLGDIAT